MFYIIYEDDHLFTSFQPSAYLKVAKRRVANLSKKLHLPLENFKIVDR